MKHDFQVQCPVCELFYMCEIDPIPETRNPDGSLIIALRPPDCNHPFLIYLDRRLSVRSTQILSDVKIEATRVEHNHVIIARSNNG